MRRIVLILLLCICAACEQYTVPHYDKYEHTLIVTCLAHNNLSNDIRKNLKDLEEDILPIKDDNKALVVFCHFPNESPILYHLYQKGGKAVRDTLKIYSDEIVTAEVLNKALKDVKKDFVSDSYGLLFSSHSTAWIPRGYDTDHKSMYSLYSFNEEDYSNYPLTKSMGDHASNKVSIYQMDVDEFVAAIPFHLDYFIADTCLLSAIEVMWEFKDITDYFLASPTEVLSQGFLYNRISRNIFSGNAPNLKQIALDYFNLYNVQSGAHRSATITLVDCRKLDKLARAFSNIIKDRETEILNFDYKKVQAYGWRTDTLCYFFDIQDFVHKLGASDTTLLNDFDTALNEAIIYHDHTPEFLGLALKNCCGISIYVPHPRRADLTNDYYKLKWSKDTKYLSSVN